MGWTSCTSQGATSRNASNLPEGAEHMTDKSGPVEWEDIDFAEDPRLVIGSRAGARGLAGRRVELHEDVFADLAAICRPVLATLRDGIARPYTPYAQLEVGEEYFWTAVDRLPERPPRRRRRRDSKTDETGGEAEDTTGADLIRIVQGVDDLASITVSQLRSARYLFYAICWPVPSSFVGFVKKADPRRVLTGGRRFFVYGNALKTADTPDLVLEPDIDVVVAPAQVAALRPSAYATLLSDIQVALSTVPSNVRAVAKKLPADLALASEAALALETACKGRVSYARRLDALTTRLDQVELTRDRFRRELRRQGINRALLLNDAGELMFASDQVGLLLDVLEGRYYEDQLGHEQRRADRFSLRHA